MTTTGRPEDVAETARWEQGKATQPDAVTFSLDWDGYHLSGTLPGDAAHRVINAAMAPNTVIRFDGLPSWTGKADPLIYAEPDHRRRSRRRP